MNFGELKNRLRDLGFLDDGDVEDNINLVVGSLNSALKTISETVKGISDIYTYNQEGTGGLTKLDLLELTKDEEGYQFSELEKVELNNERFSDYKIQLDKIVVFDGNISGEFNFFYRKRLPQITSVWPNAKELPIDYKVDEMLPLLTAYYAWLDDDSEIASRWYNEYDTLKQEYLNKIALETPKARVRAGLWER